LSNDFYLNQVKKCVTFIFVEKPTGLVNPIGTGFFVGIKLEGDYHAVYLVTAKHVLWKSSTDEFYEKVLLRLNTKKGSVEYIELDLSKHRVLTHPDKGVDLAATVLYPSQDHFDYLYILQDYFTNSDILNQKNIREGSKAFFAGLLANFHYGKQRNYPVLRFGYISLLTEEKIEIKKSPATDSTIQGHFYLVECQSLGGFSGSPVFFERDRITRERAYFTPEMYLGGVMMGHFNDVQNLERGMELNVGLALVTPCYLLEELLQSEQAKRDREKYPRLDLA
jgi:hypothetical protein